MWAVDCDESVSARESVRMRVRAFVRPCSISLAVLSGVEWEVEATRNIPASAPILCLHLITHLRAHVLVRLLSSHHCNVILRAPRGVGFPSPRALLLDSPMVMFVEHQLSVSRVSESRYSRVPCMGEMHEKRFIPQCLPPMISELPPQIPGVAQRCTVPTILLHTSLTAPSGTHTTTHTQPPMRSIL